MAKRESKEIIDRPFFGTVMSSTGFEVGKRCLTCKYAESNDEKYIYCNMLKNKAEKHGCCENYELHPKYNRIGVHRGRVKESAYFKWKIGIVAKFTKGMETNWDAYNEYIESLGGKSCLYDYWLNNIKNK